MFLAAIALVLLFCSQNDIDCCNVVGFFCFVGWFFFLKKKNTTGFEGRYGGVCICKVSVCAVQRPLSLK